MKQIEEYIRNNREKLDIYDPPEEVWEKISGQVTKKKHLPLALMSRAAMVLLLVATSFIVYNTVSVRLKTQGVSPDNNIVSLDETATYYQRKANLLMKEAQPMLTANPAIKSELMSEISNLDELCQEIRKDLKDNMNTQEVVEALIQNYRIKVEILEDALDKMKNENNDNIKSDEL